MTKDEIKQVRELIDTPITAENLEPLKAVFPEAEWINCSHSLPRRNWGVLVFVPGSLCQFVASLDEWGDWWVFGGNGAHISGKVSHWRELPINPESNP